MGDTRGHTGARHPRRRARGAAGPKGHSSRKVCLIIDPLPRTSVVSSSVLSDLLLDRVQRPVTVCGLCRADWVLILRCAHGDRDKRPTSREAVRTVVDLVFLPLRESESLRESEGGCDYHSESWSPSLTSFCGLFIAVIYQIDIKYPSGVQTASGARRTIIFTLKEAGALRLNSQRQFAKYDNPHSERAEASAAYSAWVRV